MRFEFDVHRIRSGTSVKTSPGFGVTMNDPVYVLVRTSCRPQRFGVMMKSIEAQTYRNLVTIVHTDDSEDNYSYGDIVLRSKRNPAAGMGHYNLYCNRLLAAIPGEPGWYHFMDDDDMYASDDVIERLVEQSLRTHMNIGRVARSWDQETFAPNPWGSAESFQTECFFLHTDHRHRARWWANLRGDHYYSKKLAEQLPINWIDGLVIARAQAGKGWGYRLDDDDDRPIVIRNNEVVFDETNLLKKVPDETWAPPWSQAPRAAPPPRG